MKILFFGDSITDAGRNYDAPVGTLNSYGAGYVRSVAGNLIGENPSKYTIINRGISGNRVVDLYSRIKIDAWNFEPDVISILIGINDIWHEISRKNGVELERYEKIYRMLLQETKEKLSNARIILCEPFVLKGSATEEKMESFLEIKKYAKVVKKLAEEFNCEYLPLQQKFEEKAKEFGEQYYLSDGVHPNVAGAQLIADEWLKLFKEKIDK